MTIITKLNMAKKNANKAIITLLAASAMLAAAPEAHETKTEPEKASVSKEQVADTQAQKQKMFKAAVKAKLPNKEIAKYMNFPEFIHVTKDGEFDEVAAGNFFDAIVKEKEGDKKFLNLCKGIKRSAYYDNSLSSYDYNKYYAEFIESIAKGNPEMQGLLQNTEDFFMESYGKNAVHKLAKAVKKETVCKKDFEASSIMFGMAVLTSFIFLLSNPVSAFILGNKAIEKLEKYEKAGTVPGKKDIKELEEEEEKNGDCACLSLVAISAFTILGLIAYFSFDGDKLILSNNMSTLKPLYVGLEKSMHQAYIEQEVAKEQQLQLKVAHKDASQQFQQLLKENKQPQKE